MIAALLISLAASTAPAAPAPAPAVSSTPAAPSNAAQVPSAPPPHMGQEALEASIPVYPHMTEAPVSVGETIEANGVPMNVKSFMTADPPGAVLDFYARYFISKQMPILANGDMPQPFKYPSVTALDYPEDVELSVICIPNPDKRTMVLLARADMAPLDKNVSRAALEKFGGLPPYPQAQNASAVQFTDGEVHTIRVSFETSDSPAQVQGFYSKAFSQAGASPKSESGELRASMPDGRWRLSAVADADTKHTVVTAVHVSGNKSDDDEPAGEAP